MKNMHIFVTVLFFISCYVSPLFANRGGYETNVVELGAKPDGTTDTTNYFLKAWAAACHSVGSATIHVPPGRYLLNSVVFAGECKSSNINFVIDGTLVAPSDYNVIGNKGSWITFKNINGVTISGGTIDGQGASLWDCKARSGKKCPVGAKSLVFNYSKDILIKGLTSINSQKFHIVIDNCENVNVQGVKVTASGSSPNTDGIHVESSKAVTIMRAVIKTGDDCISVGPGTTNLWIEKIACGPGHGISIGSLGKKFNEQGVANVTVKTVSFTGTQNGLRIKTWARPSKGFVSGILFQGVTMNNVKNPIIIDQNYCPNFKLLCIVTVCLLPQMSGIKISNVAYKAIQGTSATKVAVKFNCSSKTPCSGITLNGVDLTYQNQAALSSCASADGSSYGVVKPSSCL